MSSYWALRRAVTDVLDSEVGDDVVALRRMLADALEADPGDSRSAADGGTAALWYAFLAGFNASGEGWNGEYPFQDHGRDAAADATVQNAFNRWLDASEPPASPGGGTEQ